MRVIKTIWHYKKQIGFLWVFNQKEKTNSLQDQDFMVCSSPVQNTSKPVPKLLIILSSQNCGVGEATNVRSALRRNLILPISFYTTQYDDR